MRRNSTKPISTDVSHDLGYVPYSSSATATSFKRPLQNTKTYKNSEIGVWTQTPTLGKCKRPEQSPRDLKSLSITQSPSKSSHLRKSRKLVPNVATRPIANFRTPDLVSLLKTRSSGKSNVPLKGHLQLPKNSAKAKAPSIRQLSNSCSNHVASSVQEKRLIKHPANEI